MKKYEAKELMIGSWVLTYDGKTPRQIVSLTMQKAGFMRDHGRGRDFYRFDQIQGIPLSEELLKHCVTYRDMKPKEPNEQVQSLRPLRYTPLIFASKKNLRIANLAACHP